MSLHVALGEVHGLIGENGSGKSSLVKILSGYHTPDRGQVWVWGEELHFPVRSPIHHGINVVHQDLGLVGSMSVVENFGVGSGWGAQGSRHISWRSERRRCRELSKRFGLDVDPDEIVADLPPGQRAMLAIVRAVRQLESLQRPPILILDEPTAYLTSREVAGVARLMRSVRDGGGSVIFISHRLGEVLDICDRVSVLRDGQLVATVDANTSTQSQLIQMMLGWDIGEFFPEKQPAAEGSALLEVEDLRGSLVDRVSFRAERGEILAVTGLAGMGQDELPYMIAGAARHHSGRIVVRGAELRARSPRDALAAGVVLVPANRQRDGVWLAASAIENITLPTLSSYFAGGFLRKTREKKLANELMMRFRVTPLLPRQPVGSFSGGNQQKIVLAKWLQGEPQILLLHEPTQGVDAGAKKEILEIVKRFAEGGSAVVIFSADYEEVAAVAHRVLVLHHGRIEHELTGDEVTEDRVLELCNVSGQAPEGTAALSA